MDNIMPFEPVMVQSYVIFGAIRPEQLHML